MCQLTVENAEHYMCQVNADEGKALKAMKAQDHGRLHNKLVVLNVCNLMMSQILRSTLKAFSIHRFSLMHDYLL